VRPTRDARHHRPHCCAHIRNAAPQVRRSHAPRRPRFKHQARTAAALALFALKRALAAGDLEANDGHAMYDFPRESSSGEGGPAAASGPAHAADAAMVEGVSAGPGRAAGTRPGFLDRWFKRQLPSATGANFVLNDVRAPWHHLFFFAAPCCRLNAIVRARVAAVLLHLSGGVPPGRAGQGPALPPRLPWVRSRARPRPRCVGRLTRPASGCIDSWLQSSDMCPMCKQSILGEASGR
jgi:hypothetical protein